MSDLERARSRMEYLAAGTAALEEYDRTGIAYQGEDVEAYIRAIARGEKPPKPSPVKVAR
jgi:hypothetical protein